ncbi:MAG: secretin N-terminal domain-containing protein [Candidatus Omnitrophota bacterium]
MTIMKIIRTIHRTSPGIVVFLFLALDIYPVSWAIENSPVLDNIMTSEPSSITPVEKGFEGRISLDLRGIDVEDALKYIALKAGLNIVVRTSAAGKITLTVKDVPLRDAFDLILRSTDLAYDKSGNIYNIMTDAEYQKLYGKSFSDRRVVKTFRLEYAIPEQAFNFIDALKSDIGRVVVDQESGTVVVLDTEESIKEIEKAVSALEKRSSVKVFNLQYANAADVEKYLNDQLSSKNLGTVISDERNNQVVVYTLPGKMEEIEGIIAALDKKSKQVFINAQIMKITVTDDLATGVEWNLIFSELSKYLDRMMGRDGLLTLGATLPLGGTFPIVGASQALGSMTLAGVDSTGYSTTLEFLKTIGETKILSNPRLAVLNNQEARIHVGRREVYVTTTTTTGSQTQTTAEEATFLDVGIQLAVTPTINDDGYITMKIKPEISSVVDVYTTPSNNEIPIVDTSMAESTVIVKDGSTIIIGGLRRNDKSTSHQGIPYLMDIPFIGEAFKGRNDNVESTELLIMITPTIVSGDNLFTGDRKMDESERGFKQYRDYTDFKLEDPERAE